MGYTPRLLPSSNQLPIIWGLVLLGLLIIYCLPRLTRLIPSQLVVIIMLTGISIAFRFEIPTIRNLGQLSNSLTQFANLSGALVSGRDPFS